MKRQTIIAGIVTVLSIMLVPVQKADALEPVQKENDIQEIKSSVTDVFTDVNVNDWYEGAVQFVYDEGIMTGMDVTLFEPAVILPRAQFATILYRMEGTPEVEYTKRFGDIEDGQFYTDAVIWASQENVGIVTGYTDTGMFGPADSINREQLAVMMYRYARYKGYDISASADLGQFPDADQVHAFAKDAIKWAVAEGLIKGDHGKINPQGNANRAECATIIQRLLSPMSEPEDVAVDFSKPSGTPLVKKIGMFQSGLVPMERTRRDFSLLEALEPESYRLELGFGAPGWIMSDMITGTAEEPEFSFELSDEYAKMILASGGLPYWAYGYNPYPLQENDDYRSQPSDLVKWQEYLKILAAHFKEEKIRIGYHEIWNEPDCFDLFYKGTWEDYCELYKYGATGIREGNPDAVVGGPSTAWVMDPGTRYTDFLNYVKANELPLDFFSMHRYGKDYMNQINFLRQTLENAGAEFSTTSIHVNEINAALHPWPYGGDCDHYALAADILTILDDLSAQNDVETVSWAQFLESGVDALGVVDKDGHKKASYNAFEIWARMPVDRCSLDKETDTVRGMASADTGRAGVVLWNESDEAAELTAVLENLPFDRGSVEVYRIDEAHCSYGDGAGEALAPTESQKERDTRELVWSGVIPAKGVVYIEANAASGRQEPKPENLEKAEILRQYHYYYSRGASNYAYFDEDTWTARLGMGDVEWTDSTVGVLASNLPDELHVSFEVNGELQEKDANSLLGLRIDFETDSGYAHAVQFHGGLYNEERKSTPKWGTKRLPDQVVESELEDFTVRLSDYAPEDWNGRVILTFEMQNSGADTSSKVRIR